MINISGETLTIGCLARQLLTGQAAPLISDDLRNFFDDIYSRARERNQRLRDQFAELLAPLNAIAVEPIVMRGMARLLGGQDEDARLLSDIDLLVPAERRSNCMEALDGLGYRVLRDSACEPFPTVFWRSRDVGMVDLHCSIQPDYLRIDYERLAPFCLPVRIGNARSLIPDATIQILLNIVHDQLHDGDYWRGLIDARHLLDVRRLAGESVDWHRLASFFPSGLLRRALNVQLRTVKSLLGGPIPDNYCGGAWAALQVARRRFQLGHPWLMRSLTLISLAMDTPQREMDLNRDVGAQELPADRLRRRFQHYLRASNDGKMR